MRTFPDMIWGCSHERFVQAGGGKPRLEEVAYRNVPARITAVLLRVSEGHNGEEVPVLCCSRKYRILAMMLIERAFQVAWAALHKIPQLTKYR